MERPKPETIEQYDLLDCCAYMRYLGFTQEAQDLQDTVLQIAGCNLHAAYFLDVGGTTSDGAFIKCFPQFKDEDVVNFYVSW